MNTVRYLVVKIVLEHDEVSPEQQEEISQDLSQQMNYDFEIPYPTKLESGEYIDSKIIETEVQGMLSVNPC